jgi:integration host factor subunit alpha
MDDVDSAELQSASATGHDQTDLIEKSRPNAKEELPTLNKAAMAALLFDHIGLNKREAQDMVDSVFAEIGNALERGESVKLSGFGIFQLRDKPERPGRNPKTGEVVPIAARRVVTFHACQSLKARCQAECQYNASLNWGTHQTETGRIGIEAMKRSAFQTMLRLKIVES